jgi:predicted DNA binding CopG/RHH family protein
MLIAMSPKIVKAAQIVVRVEVKDRLALEKEAAALGLDLTAYVRYLLHTHQGRPHNVKAKK